MSLEEIRLSFLSRERIRNALALIAHEIVANLEVVRSFPRSQPVDFDPEPLEVATLNQAAAQILDYLLRDPQLMDEIGTLRRTYNRINAKTEMFMSRPPATAADIPILGGRYRNYMVSMQNSVDSASTRALLSLRERHSVTTIPGWVFTQHR